MKITSIYFTIIVTSSILLSCQSNKSIKWEYKVLYFDSELIISKDKQYTKGTANFKSSISSTSIKPNEEILNNLGNEGWEIVSSYLEEETVYPNLLAEGDGVLGLQPNVRPQRLFIILKRIVK
jgi:hypothetical protein